MKRIFTFVFLFSLFNFGISQIPNPSTETIGTVSGTTTIASHETNNGFDLDALTYSGTGDIRITNPSSGYPGASGSANAYLSTGGKTFIIDGFAPGPNCSTFDINFGVYKSTASSGDNGSNLVIEYSETGAGGPWVSAGSITLPVGSGTATWFYRSIIGIPASLKSLRFTNNHTSTQYRLDDLTYSASGSDCTILPVYLMNYKVEKFNNFSKIFFLTSSEINSSHFLIEWSRDANEWNEIGTVKASGTTHDIKEYTFIHENPKAGINYYRLTQVDFDGRKETFPVKSVYFGSNQRNFDIIPNLAFNNVKIEFEKPVENGRLHIYNIDGQLMQSYVLASGIDVLRIDVSELPTGQYIAKYIDGEDTINRKFIKQ